MNWMILSILLWTNLSFAAAFTPPNTKPINQNTKTEEKISQLDREKLKDCVSNSSLMYFLKDKNFAFKKVLLEESKKIFRKQKECGNFFLTYVKKYNQYLNKPYYEALDMTSKRIELEQLFIQKSIKKYEGKNVNSDEILGLQKSLALFYAQESRMWEQVLLKKDFTASEISEERGFLYKILAYLLGNMYIYIFFALIGYVIYEKIRLSKQKKFEDEINIESDDIEDFD